MNLRRLLRKSYYLSKFFYEFQYHTHALDRHAPIVVFQMGKVGSTSVIRSLRALNLSAPIFHVHAMNREARREQLETYQRLSPRQYFYLSDHALQSRYLSRELRRGTGKKRWKVISLVRNPVAQHVSSLFQNLDKIFPGIFDESCSNRPDIKTLVTSLVSHFPADGALVHWFDLEMKPIFKIDVFEKEFPSEKGFCIYKSEVADLLLFRLEDLDRCAEEAFGEFLGIEKFQLQHENVGSNKTYSALYREFASNAVLPGEYLDSICTSRMCKHFYTEEEISTFRSRWSGEDIKDIA